MFKERILSTIQFFDLQDYPLTLLELERFLIADTTSLIENMTEQWELKTANYEEGEHVGVHTILACLDKDLQEQVDQHHGFYFLSGRKDIVTQRLNNYLFVIGREKLIRRYVWFLRHIPFVRGVAIGGSQAMGQQKPTSDIDLLIVTEKNFLWIARTLITFYFQVFGHRRHGRKIANRFCLNHYIAGVGYLGYGYNAYYALEYVRFRPVVYGNTMQIFQEVNSPWIKTFFPNAEDTKKYADSESRVQKFLEKMFKNSFGEWIEEKLQQWQLGRIRSGKFVVADPQEISFHSQERKFALLSRFFKDQQSKDRETEQPVA